ARRVRRRRITLLPRPLLSLMPVSTSSELPAADGEQRRPGARLRFAVAVVGWLVLALLGVAAVLREVAPVRTRWLILLAPLAERLPRACRKRPPSPSRGSAHQVCRSSPPMSSRGPTGGWFSAAGRWSPSRE